MNHSTISRTIAWGIRLSAVVALLAGLLAVTQPARATTFVVENTNNSGPGSLRQAINDAKINSGTDTITFAAAIDGNPILLVGTAGEDLNASGDLDILDGGDLTIQGNGSANTIIDGGGIDRVFHVCPGGCANTVTLTGVTIRNGNTEYGGGISNYGTLNVQSSTIGWGHVGMGNTADYGGGIFNWGTLNVHNGSTVSANTATINGGGIYNWAGTTMVDGSTVSANTTSSFGGGILNYGILYVQNGSTIGGTGMGNSATINGGGIYNAAVTTVNGSTVSANTASRGGGIYNTSGTTTVDDSIVSANTASLGGGIFNNGILYVQNGSTIGGAGAGNQAYSEGGGINNFIGGNTMVTGSRILNNTGGNGGGVFNNRDVAGATSVTGSCIVGNSATSFFNNTGAHQFGMGNWWGAATGPNTLGADTVCCNVDYGGYLTEPILGCYFYIYLPLVLK